MSQIDPNPAPAEQSPADSQTGQPVAAQDATEGNTAAPVTDAQQLPTDSTPPAEPRQDVPAAEQAPASAAPQPATASSPPPVPSAVGGPAAGSAPEPTATIDDVMADLRAHRDQPIPTSRWRDMHPEVRLTAAQAEMQLRLYEALARQGIVLRSQHGVYGWLLDQISATFTA